MAVIGYDTNGYMCAVDDDALFDLFRFGQWLHRMIHEHSCSQECPQEEDPTGLADE